MLILAENSVVLSLQCEGKKERRKVGIVHPNPKPVRNRQMVEPCALVFACVSSLNYYFGPSDFKGPKFTPGSMVLIWGS